MQGGGLNMYLTYSNIDYLGCEDCDRLRAVDPNNDQGECSDPKEGCKKLLAGQWAQNLKEQGFLEVV